MTYHDEAITLKYLLTSLLKNMKVTAENINDKDVRAWLPAWNNVKDLKSAIYAVAAQIDTDHHSNMESFMRVVEMNDVFYLATENHRYQESVIQLIDLMLKPERIAETVTYIIHGDI